MGQGAREIRLVKYMICKLFEKTVRLGDRKVDKKLVWHRHRQLLIQLRITHNYLNITGPF